VFREAGQNIFWSIISSYDARRRQMTHLAGAVRELTDAQALSVYIHAE
jgi:hypothetical protein